MRRFLFAFVILAGGSINCFAESKAEAKMDLNLRNVGQAFLECSAYFDIVSTCAGNTANEQDLSKSYERASEGSLRIAHEVLSKTKMNEEAMFASYQMTHKDMMKDVEKRCENISILMNRYSDSCVEKMQDPTEFLKKSIDTQ